MALTFRSTSYHRHDSPVQANKETCYVDQPVRVVDDRGICLFIAVSELCYSLPIGLPNSIRAYRLYAGHQTGPEPPRALCLTQASILYTQPAL